MNIRRLILIAAIVLPLHAASALAAIAGDTGDCAVSPAAYHYLTPNVVKQVQNALAHFGLYSDRIDGIAGPYTRRGLAAYCLQRGLSVGSSMDARQVLVNDLVRDAAIDRIYHSWRNIVASPGFSSWIATQQNVAEIRSQIDNGTPGQVVSIINRYLNHTPEKPPTNSSKAQPSSPAGPAKTGTGPVVAQPVGQNLWRVSYQLDAKDFAAFAARQKALSKLAQLKNGNFQTKAAFLTSVEGLLKGNPVASAMVALTEKNADKQLLVTLGAQGLQRLQANGVPESVLSRLGTLEHPGYTSRNAALKAIQTLLAGSTSKGTGSGAQSGSVQSGSAQSGSSQTQPSSSHAQPLPADSSKWAALIASQLDEQVFYRLSDAAWAKVAQASGTVPGYVSTMLKTMQGVDYPLRSFFLAAARSHIDIGLRSDFGKILKEIGAAGLTRLDSAFFSNLEKNGVPTALGTQLSSSLKGKTYASPKALESAVTDAYKTALDGFVSYEKILAAQARKRHEATPKKGISWSASIGSRLLPNAIKDESYGFYPYWLSGTSQQIHFGSISRIGYYAASFNDNGTIQSSGWTPRNSAAFTLARKYATKLDLVVTKRNWRSWAAQTPSERDAAFKILANNIAALLNVHPNDSLARLAYYSRLGIHQPVLGNGVTLFFENYPTSADCKAEFTKFIETLRSELAPSQRINIMLSNNALGQGIFAYTDLSKLVEQYGNARRMLILVLLPEPYINAEKELRYSIEKNVQTAEKQRNLLRSTVPVIVPDGSGSIKNQVVYAADNFGGIGFWSLPVGAAGARTASAVKTTFYPISGRWANNLCSIVGPNRWILRLVFYFFLIVSLSTLAVYLLLCRFRAVMRRNFIPVLTGTVVPLAVVGMSLLGCDPLLSEISKGNIPLFLILIGVIIYALWNYAQRRKKIP